jgi:hypothetical protein
MKDNSDDIGGDKHAKEWTKKGGERILTTK